MAVGKASLKRAAKAAETEPKKEETKVAAEEKAEEAKPKTTRKRKPSGSENNSFQSSHSKNSCFRTSRAGESSRNEARRTGKSSRIREKRTVTSPLQKSFRFIFCNSMCDFFSIKRNIPLFRVVLCEIPCDSKQTMV